MIAMLRGVLVEKSADAAIIDAGGVGYSVRVSATTLAALPELTKTVTLRVTTHVRDDAIVLFGFATRAEQSLYQRLTTVKGVGPRLALSVLSGGKVEEIVQAIVRQDVRRIKQIPGVGLKTAERICLELKDRVLEIDTGASLAAAAAGAAPTGGGPREDVLAALAQLGYKEAEALRALQSAVREGLVAPDGSG
ncbi:MAG: Holliday junction branch migration protein RuvA, partial [Myxococcales bacterium]|nr:Holliday junction branch migration protein RuvA [Myxococcales bacterium]